MSNLIVAEVEKFQIRKIIKDCIVDVFYNIVTGIQYLAIECDEQIIISRNDKQTSSTSSPLNDKLLKFSNLLYEMSSEIISSFFSNVSSRSS